MLFSMQWQAASAATDAGGTYLEAAGAKIALQPTQDAGVDSNPLLAPADGQAARQANVSRPRGQPVDDGGVERNSNVARPADPAEGGLAAADEGAGGAQGTGLPRHAVDAKNGAAGNAPGQNQLNNTSPLPSPVFDPVKEAIQNLAPADAAQLRTILEQLYERQGAALAPPRPGVVERVRQYDVDLSPGATPPVIRVSRGLGAAVDFVDAAGNPWPITFAKNFYVEATNVTQMAPHVLSVAAKSPHLTGSVSVMLKGLTTPVTFIVTPAQDETDARVDLHVPGLAPDAPPMPGSLGARRPEVAGGNLKEFLYGATPKGTTRLKVDGAAAVQGNARAWQNTDGGLVLRTSAQVISPGWYDRLPALDGTAVYSLPSTPVVRVSVDGREESLIIDGLMPMSSTTASASSTAAMKY